MRHKLSIFFLGLLVMLPAAVGAEAGLTISPAIRELTINPKQPTTTSTLQLTNHTSKLERLRIQTVDFGSLDETGGLYLIGQPNDFERKYGLVNWLKLDADLVILEPGQTQTIRLAVENQPSLAPGGHYGAVLFKSDRGNANSGSASVGLQPVLTELLFLRKNGGLKEDILLQGTDLARKRSSLPSEIKLTFKNNGNVHEVPRGNVKIYDPLGKSVAQGTINDDSSIVLPEKRRKFVTKLTSSRLAIAPGKYRVVVDYRFDGNDNYTRAEYSFTLVDVPLLVGLGLFIGAILFGLWRLSQLLRRKKLFKHLRFRKIPWRS